MKTKIKLRLANFVSAAITVTIWIIFIVPICVVAYALIKYNFPSRDFSVSYCDLLRGFSYMYGLLG